MILLRILIFFGAIFVGILILRYTERIVDMVGHMEWAERYLGFGAGGGTYTFWKIMGILVIIVGVVLGIKGW
jgi:hypothetical protein